MRKFILFFLIFLFASSYQVDASGYVFNRDLKFDLEGEDVRQLQIILNSNPVTEIVAPGLLKKGTKGRETTYFGRATEDAVKKFQLKYKISPISGFVGPITRSLLNNLVSSSTIASGIASSSASQSLFNISWSNGNGEVQIGLVDSRFETNKTVLGWIKTKQATSGSLIWDGKRISELSGPTNWSVSSLSTGPYRILANTYGVNNIMCVGTDSSCVYVLSPYFYMGTSTKDIILPPFTLATSTTTKPSITFTSPSGSSRWQINTSRTITWRSSNVGNYLIDIDLVNTSGDVASAIATGVKNTGSYSWYIDLPSEQTGTYRIRISTVSSSGVTDGVKAWSSSFTLTPPSQNVCSFFSYSVWSDCVNGRQTRTKTGQFPDGCSGGNPVLSQSCSVTDASFNNTASVSESGGGFWNFIKNLFR